MLIYNNHTYYLTDGYTKATLIDVETGAERKVILNTDNNECQLAMIDNDLYLLDPNRPCQRIKLTRK